MMMKTVHRLPLTSIFSDGCSVGVIVTQIPSGSLVGTRVSVKNGVGGGIVPVAAKLGVDGIAVATTRMSNNSPG